MELPKRKPTRIPGFDYGRQNYYFVTLCTHKKACLFWKNNQLNDYGKIVESCILQIPQHYSGVTVEKYVVMPNHIHAVIAVEDGTKLTQIIGQLKIAVTKQIHKTTEGITVWQRSFHDHIVRNQQDYERIWLYIHGNPQRWSEDCFYTTEDV